VVGGILEALPVLAAVALAVITFKAWPQKTELLILAAVLAAAVALIPALLEVLESLLFVTQTLTAQQNLQLDRQPIRFLVVTEFTLGPALARLRFKRSSWRTLHNLMKTTSLRELS
jgi:hypothetical protein